MIYLPLPNIELHDHEIQLQMKTIKIFYWIGECLSFFNYFFFKPTFFDLCIFLVKLLSNTPDTLLQEEGILDEVNTKYFYSVTKVCKISQSTIISYSTSSIKHVICLNSNDIHNQALTCRSQVPQKS